MTTIRHNTVTSLFALTLPQRTMLSEKIAKSKPQNVGFAISTMPLLNVVQVTTLPNLMGSIGVAGPYIRNETENNKTRNRII